MTHAELVTRAARWLRSTIKCGVVLTEHNAGSEFPDAIGWKSGFSYLVECKVSRSDFLADLKKTSRASYEVRPAFQCYYLTPPQLLDPDVWPNSPFALPHGWGLLEAHARHVKVVTPALPSADTCDDRSADQLRDEIYRMYCELRRYQAQGLKPQTLDAYLQQQREEAQRCSSPTS